MLAEPLNPGDPGIQVFPHISDNGNIVWLTDESGDDWTVTVLNGAYEEATMLEDTNSTGLKGLSNLLNNTCKTLETYDRKVNEYAQLGSLDSDFAMNLLRRSEEIQSEVGCD